MDTNLTPLQKLQQSMVVSKQLKDSFAHIEEKLLALEGDVHEFNKKYKEAMDALVANRAYAKSVIEETRKNIDESFEKDNEEFVSDVIGAALEYVEEKLEAKQKNTI